MVNAKDHMQRCGNGLITHDLFVVLCEIYLCEIYQARRVQRLRYPRAFTILQKLANNTRVGVKGKLDQN